MKTKLPFLVLALSVLAGAHKADAQSPIITSFSQNGILVCSNLEPGSVASVEWAPSLSGPWSTNWAGLDAVTADSTGQIQVSVPMFYRVLGVAQAPNCVPTNMVLIPASSFTMGDNLDGESDATSVSVTVTAFYMESNLVTFSQWQLVYNWATNAGYCFDDFGSGKAPNHPVQSVNWYDIVKWSNARSQQEGLTPVYFVDEGLTQVYTNGDVDAVYANWTANGYRLPTEAEWEKAARGGLTGQRFPWGDTISESQANYDGNTATNYDLGPNGYNANFATGDFPYTSPAGYFAPNGYGLYDMAGNVDEWCWDWYGTPYEGGSDPRGPSTQSFRVVRGGSYPINAYYARCAFRSSELPSNTNINIGFRCVRGI